MVGRHAGERVIYYYDQNSAGPKMKINARVAYHEPRRPAGAHARTRPLHLCDGKAISYTIDTHAITIFVLRLCARTQD